MSENSREAIVAAVVSAKQIYLGGVSRIVDGFEKIDPTLSLESVRTIRRTLHEQRSRTKLGVLALEDSYAVPAPDLINGEVATLEDMVNDCRVVIRTLHSDLLLMYESVQDYSILPADLSSRTYFVEGFLGEFRLHGCRGLQAPEDEAKEHTLECHAKLSCYN